MKEYNHIAKDLLTGCGFTEEEMDKCLEATDTLYKKFKSVSSFVEEVEKMITSGKYPTFTRFVIVVFSDRFRTIKDNIEKDALLRDLFENSELSKSFKIISLTEKDMPKELLDKMTSEEKIIEEVTIEKKD